MLRNGARALLAQSVEAEAAALLASHADNLTEDGRRRLVRHGHLPEREVMTGIGPVAMRCPRVRDRVGEGSERIRFSSAILPPYARRSKTLEVLIPILYLKGVSTGDFEEALVAAGADCLITCQHQAITQAFSTSASSGCSQRTRDPRHGVRCLGLTLSNGPHFGPRFLPRGPGAGIRIDVDGDWTRTGVGRRNGRIL